MESFSCEATCDRLVEKPIRKLPSLQYDTLATLLLGLRGLQCSENSLIKDVLQALLRQGRAFDVLDRLQQGRKSLRVATYLLRRLRKTCAPRHDRQYE